MRFTWRRSQPWCSPRRMPCAGTRAPGSRLPPVGLSGASVPSRPSSRRIARFRARSWPLPRCLAVIHFTTHRCCRHSLRSYTDHRGAVCALLRRPGASPRARPWSAFDRGCPSERGERGASCAARGALPGRGSPCRCATFRSQNVSARSRPRSALPNCRRYPFHSAGGGSGGVAFCSVGRRGGQTRSRRVPPRLVAPARPCQ